MAVYLVQHGKSLAKEIDPEQGLSEEGVAEVKRIAEVAKVYDIQVSEILHSTKKRACQTAEIYASFLAPEKGIREVPGIQPLDDAALYADTLDSTSHVMVVSHMPFLQKLVSRLITGSDGPALFKIQNGGVLCMDKDPDTGSWIIKWALMPNVK